MDNKTLTLQVRLSPEEFDALDEARGTMTRSALVRSLIRQAAAGELSPVATREEALALLTQAAKDGKVNAQIALARELRADAPVEGDELSWLTK